MLFLLESMRKALFWRRKMAAWRAKLDDGEMCCSCYDTTKYTCLKCKSPICNKCSIFEEVYFLGSRFNDLSIKGKITERWLVEREGIFFS